MSTSIYVLSIHSTKNLDRQKKRVFARLTSNFRIVHVSWFHRRAAMFRLTTRFAGLVVD
jgi:hypothetical protein